jgi:hypothetical protein
LPVVVVNSKPLGNGGKTNTPGRLGKNKSLNSAFKANFFSSRKTKPDSKEKLIAELNF